MDFDFSIMLESLIDALKDMELFEKNENLEDI